MNRDAAIKAIKKAIKKQYGTQVAAAKALGVSHILISRVLTGITEQIAPELLDLAGLEAVIPPTNYRRKEQ